MNPVIALTRLFGELAPFWSTKALKLPDGTSPAKGVVWSGGLCRPDHARDLGVTLSAFYRLQRGPEGNTLGAVLEEWFSRAGVENQTERLNLMAEALEKRGIRPLSRRAKKRKAGQQVSAPLLQRYGSLLAEGINAYREALRAA